MWHNNNQNIPVEYRNLSIHIALERADDNKDWDAFRLIYRTDPDFLKEHLKNTSIIFDYNFAQLPEKDRDELFNI